jgi:hypothetical protein
MAESRHEKFRRIAGRRTNDVLEKLRLLGNCSNALNYEYSDNEVDEIFKAVEEAVCKSRQLFKKKNSESFSFKFDQ